MRGEILPRARHLAILEDDLVCMSPVTESSALLGFFSEIVFRASFSFAGFSSGQIMWKASGSEKDITQSWHK
jgi:hypothetical protein